MNKINQSQEQILKDIRHDLTNPVNAILGYSEYLLELIEDDINIILKKDINTIYVSGKKIMKVIDNSLLCNNRKSNNSLMNLINDNALQFSIRTPLSTIIGISELLQDDKIVANNNLDVEELKLCINHIKSSAIKLLKIINNLKKYSEIDISTFIESYYTDVYLKESSVRQIDFSAKTTSSKNIGSILIVEDEIYNLDLIEKILLQFNHKVFKAKNAVEALDILNNNSLNIDLILLDLIMPEINGVELLKKIKADKKIFHIPIIMLSASDDIEAIVETILLGADDYLMKPINKILLNARINNALEKKYFHDKELEYQSKIKKEQDKADSLLLNILPNGIAARLKNGETLIADNIDCATVLFADIVGFTTLSSTIDAKSILMMLNTIFSEFDELLIKHSLEKIKTIGDNYMLAGGVPKFSENHADSVVKMAIDMLDVISNISIPMRESFELKIGINTGPLSAGVIGRKKFIYDLWGDTVNVASRMEVFGLPNRIHISKSTYNIIKKDYNFIKRKLIQIPGKGKMQTYLLESIAI